MQDGINTLSVPQVVLDEKNAHKLNVSAGNIKFQNVNFSYIDNEKIITNPVFDSLFLEVSAGERIGIVGRSGAGKSTLLKLIAGITRPTEGSLRIRSSLATLLDLGLGFHRNFTGRENIRMNCSLLGYVQLVSRLL